MGFLPLYMKKMLQLSKRDPKDNKGKAGVYRWTNKENGKTYIGSSVNLGRRLSEYFSIKFLQKEIDKNKSLIYRALLNYEYSKFKLEILEYCDSSEVINREQYYLDHFKGEYNILSTAGSRLGSRHSEATRAKIRESKKKNWQDPARRETSFAGLAAGPAARSKAVLVTNIETGETVEYVSQTAAAKALGVSRVTICNCLKSKKLLKQKYMISVKSIN